MVVISCVNKDMTLVVTVIEEKGKNKGLFCVFSGLY